MQARIPIRVRIIDVSGLRCANVKEQRDVIAKFFECAWIQSACGFGGTWLANLLAALLRAREFEHPGRQIDARHPSAAPREKPRVGALAASRIEDGLAAQVAGEFNERGIVPMLAKDVPPV